MSKAVKVIQANASNPKLLIALGIGLAAGVVILTETRRRRRRRANAAAQRKDFGAFVVRFELLPFPQPPPPAARLPLSSLTFAIKDIFDVKDYVTGFGSRDWERTHEVSEKTAVAVTALLKNGATCVGKTVMDELAFGITGENRHYGTPTNPQMPSCIPGGSSSGSAVAVAAGLVDFALGTDTIGCVRIPASFCGILGFRPSHGAVSMIGVLRNSQSLDTVGCFARDPSILHRVGHVLLKLNSVEPRRARRLIFADDLFQFSKVPPQKILNVVNKAIENLSGYKPPKHTNFGQYVGSNVPSLKQFQEPSSNLQNGTSTLKALSSVMVSLQRLIKMSWMYLCDVYCKEANAKVALFLLHRYEFKTNHEEWVNSVKPKLGPDVSDRVLAAINTTHKNMKILYKVRTEMRVALQNLLKDDGILVIPTVADSPLKLNTKKGLSAEFHDRIFALSSIASISGCCQVSIPLGKHNDCPISVSFITFHGADKFLLDTVLDMYSSLQEQASIASNSVHLPDTNGNMDASELLKEKGNAAFKGMQWNKAVKYYTEAINLNSTIATYFCNRAAAYLELGCFQQAEEDCSKAILLDRKQCGLGVREVVYFNKALLGKWLRHFAMEEQALWRTVVASKYGCEWVGWSSKEVWGGHGFSLWKFIRFGWELFSRSDRKLKIVFAGVPQLGIMVFGFVFIWSAVGYAECGTFVGVLEAAFLLLNRVVDGDFIPGFQVGDGFGVFGLNVDLGVPVEEVEGISVLNVKAYLRRGTARESLLHYKESAEDFKHALVLEPQNKVASRAEKRLRKLMS
uniref:Amidase domain-containing protein n=1 Tax=Quercus lobata TaxID=97700 RepID=A0A7N2MVH3_QUELO